MRLSRTPKPIPASGGRLQALMAFAHLARLGVLPALLMPVLWGTALAWWQTGRFSGWRLGLLLLGHGALYLCLNLLIGYYDHRRSVQQAPPQRVEPPAEPIVDGYHLMVQRVVSPGTVRSLGLICLTIGLASIVWMGYLAGWPLFFFGGLNLLLVIAYVVPPIAYGYRWWGLGELGLLLGIGLLPPISSFYTQTLSLTWPSVWSAVPLALLALVAFSSYDFMNWRRDWKFRKMTLVVRFGLQRALDIHIVIGVAAFAGLILQVALGNLPVWTLLALAALPALLRAIAFVHQEEFTRYNRLRLIESATNAAVLAGLLSILALWIDK